MRTDLVLSSDLKLPTAEATEHLLITYPGALNHTVRTVHDLINVKLIDKISKHMKIYHFSVSASVNSNPALSVPSPQPHGPNSLPIGHTSNVFFHFHFKLASFTEVFIKHNVIYRFLFELQESYFHACHFRIMT